jgi:hypothetical protein
MRAEAEPHLSFRLKKDYIVASKIGVDTDSSFVFLKLSSRGGKASLTIANITLNTWGPQFTFMYMSPAYAT